MISYLRYLEDGSDYDPSTVSDEVRGEVLVADKLLKPLYKDAAQVWMPKQNNEPNDPDSDPAFDLTVTRTSDEPAAVTALGFEVLMAGIRHPTFGDSYEAFVPDIFHSYQLNFPDFSLPASTPKSKWQGYIWDMSTRPVASVGTTQ